MYLLAKVGWGGDLQRDKRSRKSSRVWPTIRLCKSSPQTPGEQSPLEDSSSQPRVTHRRRLDTGSLTRSLLAIRYLSVSCVLLVPTGARREKAPSRVLPPSQLRARRRHPLLDDEDLSFDRTGAVDEVPVLVSEWYSSRRSCWPAVAPTATELRAPAPSSAHSSLAQPQVERPPPLPLSSQLGCAPPRAGRRLPMRSSLTARAS